MMKGANVLLILILSVSSVMMTTVPPDEDIIVATTTETPQQQQPPWQRSTKAPLDRLRYLFDSGEYSDVSVIVENETFHLHRSILAMTSSVLAEKLYPGNQMPPSAVTLSENIDPLTFQRVLKYIYKNEVELSSVSDNWELWRAAATFQIDDLVQKTAEHIKTSINVDNVLEALVKAVENNENNLQETCMEIIENNTTDILSQPYFLQLNENDVKLIVGNPKLNATEAQILQGVLEWADTSMSQENVTNTPENVRHHLRDILPLFDFNVMTPEEFVTIVEPSGVLTPDSLIRVMLKMMMMPTREASKTRRALWDVANDIDECLVNNGGCAQVCINTAGSFQCSCRNGFILQKNGRDCKDPDGCLYEFTNSRGEFSSPNYPDTYSENTYCEWHFKTTPGRRIKLVFDMFQLEENCEYDRVTIYDGASLDSGIVGPFCGSNLLGPIISSTANNMIMTFKSDGSGNFQGFHGIYMTVL